MADQSPGDHRIAAELTGVRQTAAPAAMDAASRADSTAGIARPSAALHSEATQPIAETEGGTGRAEQDVGEAEARGAEVVVRSHEADRSFHGMESD